MGRLGAYPVAWEFLEQKLSKEQREPENPNGDEKVE
jgi:hypothetical protein